MPRKRADGYYVKGINPYTKIMPHIMPERSDSMNMTFVEVECDGIDSFIRDIQSDGGWNLWRFKNRKVCVVKYARIISELYCNYIDSRLKFGCINGSVPVRYFLT